MEAVPPLPVRHHRQAPAAQVLLSRSAASASALVTSVTQRRAAVHVSPGRRLLNAHRTAVIQHLAPRAPLVRSRRLAATLAAAPSVKAIAARRAPSATERTIAALGASLRKK